MEIITKIEGQFKKAHEFDAGYDIISAEEVNINGLDKAVIKTGLQVFVPKGYVGVLKSRSGLSVKHDLEVGAGVIDSGYTGEVLVVLRNHSSQDYTVHIGDKIAQMLILPVPNLEIINTSKVPETDRGSNGFNSTGY